MRREMPSPGAKVALSATRAASPARKTMAMIMPMPMPKDSASTMRAMAKSAPSATPVYDSARMLAAGAKNRKVMAGPSPAPFL